MTKVTYTRFLKHCRLDVVGHATGNPEVCAGVSTLVYALAGYLESTGAKRRTDLKSGEAHITAQREEQVEAAFDMAVIGLLQLEKAHPEYVQVKLPADVRVKEV